MICLRLAAMALAMGIALPAFSATIEEEINGDLAALPMVANKFIADIQRYQRERDARDNQREQEWHEYVKPLIEKPAEK